MTVEFETEESFFQFLRDNKKVIVKFFATWCGACKSIRPFFNELANSGAYKGVKFANVDVDRLPKLANRFGVHAMPTFVFYVNGSKVEEFVGASDESLLEMLARNK